MHRFPNPNKYPERFKSWVTLVGGKLETNSDYEYYKRKRICDIHFSDSVRNRCKRLRIDAVPALHLTGQTAEKNWPLGQSLPVLLHSSQEISAVQTHGTTKTLEQCPSSLMPQSSKEVNEDQSKIFEQQKASTSREYLTTQPDSIVQTEEEPKTMEQSSYSLTPQSLHAVKKGTIAVPNRVALEHNYSLSHRSESSREKGVRSTKQPVYYTLTMKPLKSKIKRLQTEVSRLRKKGKLYRERLEAAENISENTMFQHVIKNMTKPAQLFAHMQIQGHKKPKGRRFTLQEKVLSLSLYKKSPKCYALLYKYFALPSAKSMKVLLSKIKISPGINPIIFEKIKKTVASQPASERLCSLMFDEMSLTPQVFYNEQKDALEGFATNQDAKFANHALVFMVKGIKKSFKQPIAYYFTTGLNKLELKKLIKVVVTKAQESGLIIINTVCDQSTVNVGAITELVNEAKASYLRRGKEWRHDIMRFNGRTVIPIYDAPHLIKGVRNNLLTKDMIYTVNGEEKVVKWNYFEKLYAADKTYGELRLAPKITEEHVNAEKLNKMRVKLATQIFSHSVAKATEHLTGRGDLPEECRQLIPITLLLDNIFDSLNVSSLTGIPNGKKYKGPIHQNTPHHKLWKDAVIILKTVKFIKHKKVGNKVRIIETTAPSIQNLIKTIEGMEAIWEKISRQYRLDTFLSRNCNQDPVENFFGNIRSYGARNINPNTVAFESAYKALLLNNYSSSHSTRANCEEDASECLQSLEFFVTEKTDDPDVSEESLEIKLNGDMLNFESRELDAGQGRYVCGWALTKFLQKVKCSDCKQILTENVHKNRDNDFISVKEYSNKKWLCYPSESLQNYFNEIQHVTKSFLEKGDSKKFIKRDILSFADMLIPLPQICNRHKEEFRLYTKTTMNVILYSWCKTVNRILKGKITYNGPDVIKTNAQIYYDKRKHYKNKK